MLVNTVITGGNISTMHYAYVSVQNNTSNINNAYCVHTPVSTNQGSVSRHCWNYSYRNRFSFSYSYKNITLSQLLLCFWGMTETKFWGSDALPDTNQGIIYWTLSFFQPLTEARLVSIHSSQSVPEGLNHWLTADAQLQIKQWKTT